MARFFVKLKNVTKHSVRKFRNNGHILKMCERSELVNISQFFRSFSQTRHLTVEMSQPKSKSD